MVNTVKFSQFATASLNQQAATVVGVENGINYKSQRFLSWTTATRPASPFNGLLGYNTDLQQYEYWNAVLLQWIQLSIEGIDILALLASHVPGEGASLVGLQNQSVSMNKTVQDLADAPFVLEAEDLTIQNGFVLAAGSGVTLTPGVRTLTIAATGSGGTVTSLTAGTGITLTPNPITTTGSIALTTPVTLTNGGTNASLVASNGGIVYSNALSLAILAGTATARQMLQSGATSPPSWSTATWPATTTINQILFSSANNVVSEIATLASGTLITSAGGVPSISQTLPLAVQSNITQLGTQTQALNMGSHLINNVSDPVSAQDAMTLHFAGITYLALAGGTMAGDISMGSAHRVTNALDPVNPQDYATRNYVDQTALNSTSVYAASAASLGTVTQSGAGVGATLTNAGVQATFALDGVNPPVGSNVLIKNTATGMTAANEGIYVVTNAGSGATNWVLTRATGYDTATEINNTGLIVVQNGSTLAGTAWYNAATIVTVDTTNFNFVRFGTTGTVTSIASGDTTVTLTPDPIVATGTIKVNTATFVRNVKTQVITTTGSSTYTPSAGLIAAIVEIVGGGGQGGGSNSAAGTGSGGNGGGGAGYCRQTYTATQIGASATVVIGTGGSGAAAGAAGNAGGNSTFTPAGAGVVLTAGGGGGGAAGAANAAANATALTNNTGTATNGEVQIPGSFGSSGWVIAAGVIGMGGAGGMSVLSTISPVTASATVSAGSPGNGYGTGGGGGISNGAGGARAGGAGTQGICIITEFCNQ